MDQGQSDKRAPRPRRECNRVVTAEQQVRFLLGIRNGLTVKGAARWAKVGLTAIYWLRRTDASFAELWAEAFAGAKADTAAVRAQERAAGDAAQGVKVARDEGTLLKRKRRHATEFTRERRQVFLDHFAESTNMAAAAAAAGVTVRTVRKTLAEDEGFAEAFDMALRVGYKSLEAETLAQQQQAYRLSGDGAGTSGDPQTFERSLQLLREYRRPDGKVGRRASRRNLKHVSQEELVEKFVKLMGQLKQRRALLRQQGLLPPPDGAAPFTGPLDC